VTSEKLPERDPARLRSVLDEGRPVAISVPVYNSWYQNPDTHVFGFVSMPLPTSLLRGGHAMCIAGYDWDEGFAGGGYFILRNSWGATWAPESPLAPGYGALPFLYVEKYAWEAFTATV
jgi:C1A family cysteine protease